MTKNSEVEESRIVALSRVASLRTNVEHMALRPRKSDDDLNRDFLKGIFTRFDEIAVKVGQAATVREIDLLVDEADSFETYSAYICPVHEVRIEGILALELMEWWGVPKSEVAALRECFVKDLEKAAVDPEVARSALRALFSERDAWEDYRDDYEGTMHTYAKLLVGAAVGLPVFALCAFYFASYIGPLLIVGLLLGGIAGSCASVASKLPGMEVGTSEKLDSYARRILSRVGLGAITSLIACGLLGGGFVPLSLQGHTFAELLNSCSGAIQLGCSKNCGALQILILLAFALLFGFTERALTWFEERLFGKPSRVRK